MSDSSTSTTTPFIAEDVVRAAVAAVARLPAVPACVALEFAAPARDALWLVRALRAALADTLAGQTAAPRLCVLHDSRCCPGVVAAAKIRAGLLLHFGPTCCCCPRAALPCPLAVLPNPFVPHDAPALAAALVDATRDAGTDGPVVVALDAELGDRAASLCAAVPAPAPLFCHQTLLKDDDDKEDRDAKDDGMLCFAGWRLPRDIGTLVYVGSSRAAACAMQASVPAAAFRAVFLPGSDSEGNDDEGTEEAARMLVRGRMGLAMRRSHALEAVRDAESMALLVAGPLHADAARALRARIADVPVHTVAMAEVDEYRLANLPEAHAGVAVIVACPYTLTFVQTRRFDRPVVSAAECVAAITDDPDWVEHYTTDIDAALSRLH